MKLGTKVSVADKYLLKGQAQRPGGPDRGKRVFHLKAYGAPVRQGYLFKLGEIDFLRPVGKHDRLVADKERPAAFGAVLFDDGVIVG